MPHAARDERLFSYADYRSWSDEVRYELLDGVARAMSPAPSFDHQTLAFEVGHQLRTALEAAPCRVLLAPIDVLLPRGDEADDAVDTVVQPDLLIFCDPAKARPRGLRGAPDFIMEVLSPASAGHDQIRKLALYERAGVREYWLAHPSDRLLTIHLLEGGRYGRPRVVELTGETALAVLPEVRVRWAPVTERLLPNP